MRHNLIKTENYLLVVDDSVKKINNGEYYLLGGKHVNMWGGSGYRIMSELTCKIIAHLPLNNASYLDGIPVLPSLEVNDFEYKLRRTPMSEIQNEFGEDVMYNLGVFIKGYNKAKEKYKWTDDDIIRIVEKSRETGLTAQYLMLSLQQSIPIAFECEMEISVFGAENTLYDATIEDYVKLKTTINSEGMIEWVGKYIYE
jgi:hypothetical protein